MEKPLREGRKLEHENSGKLYREKGKGDGGMGGTDRDRVRDRY